MADEPRESVDAAEQRRLQREQQLGAEREAAEREAALRRLSPAVRFAASIVGVDRAVFLSALLAGAWPFLRIVMVFAVVWVAAGTICYRVETRRNAPVTDDAVVGTVAAKTYRAADGEAIVRKGDAIDATAQERLLEADHTTVRTLNHHMYTDWGDAIWWSIVTMTTVGYGDRFPETHAGRVVAVVLMLGSLVLVSSFTATFASAFVARRIQEVQQQRDVEWENHTLFCGWNDMAVDVIRALNASSRGRRRQVVVINDREEEWMSLQLRGYDNLEIRFIRGNFVAEEELLQGNVRHAAAVLMVPDAPEGGQPNDLRTIEATVTIKDLAPEVKVFAHVYDPERVTNVRRSMVDDVVVTNQYIPELLCGFVTQPGVPQAIRQVMTPEESGLEIAVEAIPAEYVDGTPAPLRAYYHADRDTELIGLVSEEEGFGLDAAMQGGDPYIVEFIKEQIAEAGITTQAEGSRTRVTLLPADDQIIGASDRALVLRRTSV